MCIRYELDSNRQIIWSETLKSWIPVADFVEGVDQFPGYVAPIITPDWSRGRVAKKAVKARWGMIPGWAEDASYGKKNAYNARSETIAEKPTFREAIRKRRCVIPATRIYERTLDYKRWVKVSPADESLGLSIAGIWEEPNRHTELPTFALVTTEPNGKVGEVHDRMPVLLGLEDVEVWLDPDSSLADLRVLMTPAPDEWVTVEDGGPVEPARKKVVAGTASLFDDL